MQLTMRSKYFCTLSLYSSQALRSAVSSCSALATNDILLLLLLIFILLLLCYIFLMSLGTMVEEFRLSFTFILVPEAELVADAPAIAAFNLLSISSCNAASYFDDARV